MIQVVKTVTGENIIGEKIGYTPTGGIILKNAIKAIVTYESIDEPPKVYYMLFNELSSDEELTIHSTALVYVVEASKDIGDFYTKNINKMIEAKNSLDYGSEDLNTEYDLETMSFKTMN